jgi:hypothetical protein
MHPLPGWPVECLAVNLRAPGPNGYSIPGWASDETIEDLRKAWFAAADEEQRRLLADKISAAHSRSDSICRSGNSSLAAPFVIRSAASPTPRSRCCGTSRNASRALQATPIPLPAAENAEKSLIGAE